MPHPILYNKHKGRMQLSIHKESKMTNENRNAKKKIKMDMIARRVP